MDKKIILSLLIVALIGIVAATYQINNGSEVFNPLSNVAVEENPVTESLAAPEHSSDGAQATSQQQQQQQQQQQEQQQQPVDQNVADSQNNNDANTEATAQQSATTSNSQPQTASSDSEHVEGSNGNNGDNQGQNNPQSTVTVNDNPNNNEGTNDNSGSNNNQNGNSQNNNNNNPSTTNNNAVEPDYSQNEGNNAQLDDDGEVLDSGIDASVISSSEVFSKLESFVKTRWLQSEPVHLDNAQEYTSDSGERYYRYDIVRDSDNTVVGQASFNRRTGKVLMMDNSGPSN